MKRRNIDFHSANQIIEDVNHLRENGYQMLGKWNLTQMCQHLDGTMSGGMDGFGFRLPWILRATVANWGFRYALRSRKIGRGFPTFRILKPTHSDADDDNSVIDACIQTIKRADAFDGSLENYPLLNNLSVEDWKSFMWLHAAHHLSFLIPNKS